MGFDPFTVMAVVSVAALGAAYIFAPSADQSTANSMSPNTLESFAITTATEGDVIPLSFGKRKMKGNLIWYDNLVTEVVTGVASGGKGGGDDVTYTKGYNYYLDIWQVVCVGKTSLESVYLQDEIIDLEDYCESYTWCDGTSNTVSDEESIVGGPLPGIAHIFIKKFFLGFNVTTVPTLQFLTNRVPQNIPFPYVSEEFGINPAAVIYDVLVHGGAKSYEINIPYFSAAALYWHNKNYGLNISFESVQKVKSYIELVLSFVGGIFFLDNDNLYGIKSLDPNEGHTHTIAETIDGNSDCISVKIQTKTWSDTFNIFNGNFQSKDLNETKRVVTVKNSASIALLGRKLPKNVDLSGFRDQDSATKRLTEIMKNESYPSSSIEIEVFLDFLDVQVGNIIKFSSETYGVTESYFRIIHKDITNIDENKITLIGEQVVEKLNSSSFTTPSVAAIWVKPNHIPLALSHIDLMELPRNPVTKNDTVLLILASKRTGLEEGFALYGSSTGTDYTLLKYFTSYSQKGILTEAYPSTTNQIDDWTGILYTPYNEDPSFFSVSRTDLFSGLYFRLAFIGTEILGFQYYIYEGATDVRLKGVVRGLFNTAIGAHAIGTAIWISDLVDCSLVIPSSINTMYYKISPVVLGQNVPLANITAKVITYTRIAKIPWNVNKIKATRVGDNVTITWYPVDYGNNGAGTVNESTNAPNPMIINSTLSFVYYLSYDSTNIYVTSTSCVISRAGNFNFYIATREGAYLSTFKYVYVGSTDGDYYGY